MMRTIKPRYYYHLKFELYPSPSPESAEQTGSIWLPPPQASAFDHLPSHPRQNDRRGARAKPRGGGGIKDRGRRRRRIHDWRFGRVSIETADPTTSEMAPSEPGKPASSAAPTLGPSLGGAGTATKAECLSLDTKHTELGWGVVRFYRDGEETPTATCEDGETTAHVEKGDKEEEEQEEEEQEEEQERMMMMMMKKKKKKKKKEEEEEACCVLCIPAVPAYMSPGDFMGFVGDRWMGDISHCRMVMTSSMNRFLVLLRFRDAERAKLWKHEFDGKVFNSMESRVCHVVMVKSITFETPTEPRRKDQPAAAQSSSSSSSVAVSSSLKPFPPPTPNLIELPTCPVCLERMDETNGLMTIACSHVFHCTCLQNWRGGGCPVCRFTNASSHEDGDDPNSKSFGAPVSNLCSVCDCADDLWICLICGHVGCGRYKGGHAKDHWKETAHCFALELETQYVWDYAGDMWVHRLIRDKGDGKVVELPERGSPHGGQGREQQQQPRDEDVVPRAKLENIGLEYTHLITSQLESQRAYYEDMISKAADKAAAAASAAESSTARSAETARRLDRLEEGYRTLSSETVPQLERDLERQRGRADRAETLARKLGQSLQEEKRINEGLMQRIAHLGSEAEALRGQMAALGKENEELKESNRDLGMFISGQEKLKAMELEGTLGEGEAAEGSVGVAESGSRCRRRQRNKR
ncbi:hypothetical protein L249_2791 [Ophiocordyceps polyrhachis-furcata BCC 54312]|uniref:RING-type domain-containing protein n=1 Tax=Ophiocordyceps polyrhachis-furcata BCC 54312 TaxID=1330021 RepID=A0A367LSP7_9HYPO|nr:hypothetical protein L249_2791 [Ophiocordyceps polyrhachis-furcata BCC 54312]